MTTKQLLLLLTSSALLTFKCHSQQLMESYGGGVFLGSGDLIGSTLGFEYSKTLTDQLSFAGGIFMEQAISPLDDLSNHTSSRNALLGLRFKPFDQSTDWLSLQTGIALRSVTTSNNEPGFINQIYRENAVGIHSLLRIRVFQRNQLSLAVRNHLNFAYTNGDIAWGIALSAGVKF